MLKMKSRNLKQIFKIERNNEPHNERRGEIKLLRATNEGKHRELVRYADKYNCNVAFM